MSTIKNNISRLRMHEHDGSLRELLSVIEDSLTVSSIMTPWRCVDGVVGETDCMEAQTQAKALMDRHSYSGVPLTSSSGVRGAYLRPEPQGPLHFDPIRPELFVPANLGLVGLAQYMRDHRFIALVVGTADVPVGWLTYADFSKRPFRVLLFAIVAEVECLLACALDMAHPDDSWSAFVPSDPAGKRDHRADLLKRQAEAKSWDAAMPLTTFADIGHLVRAIPQSPTALQLLGETAMIEKRLLAISGVRNSVSHVVRPVIAGPGRIPVVADQIDMLLGWIDQWSVRLSSHNASGTPT